MRLRGSTVWAVVGGALILAAGARGAAAAAEPFYQAVLGADQIVYARAAAESGFVVRAPRGAKRREVRTDWRLEVQESWKGQVPQGHTLTLRVKGGRVGNFAEHAEDDPVILQGEFYLCFLAADSTSRTWRPWSRSWGCLPSTLRIVTLPEGLGRPRAQLMWLRKRVQNVLRNQEAGADSGLTNP